jgi:hypothetical protein
LATCIGLAEENLGRFLRNSKVSRHCTNFRSSQNNFFFDRLKFPLVTSFDTCIGYSPAGDVCFATAVGDPHKPHPLLVNNDEIISHPEWPVWKALSLRDKSIFFYSHSRCTTDQSR